MGNIADLFIFSRHPDNEDIDCMYRQQQATLGMCRRPEGMWGRTFWNEMTTGEPGRQLFLSGDAQLVPGVGLDLTNNNKIRAMGDKKPGGYMLMDGNSEERGSLTLQACGQFCKDGGYAFAGLQAGMQCFCDNSYLLRQTFLLILSPFRFTDLFGEQVRHVRRVRTQRPGAGIRPTQRRLQQPV